MQSGNDKDEIARNLPKYAEQVRDNGAPARPLAMEMHTGGPSTTDDLVDARTKQAAAAGRMPARHGGPGILPGASI